MTDAWDVQSSFFIFFKVNFFFKMATAKSDIIANTFFSKENFSRQGWSKNSAVLGHKCHV